MHGGWQGSDVIPQENSQGELTNKKNLVVENSQIRRIYDSTAISKQRYVKTVLDLCR